MSWSRLVGAFRCWSLWNQKTEPCNWLVPFLVTMLTIDPEARPYSGANWFVISRNSATMSGLLSGWLNGKDR